MISDLEKMAMLILLSACLLINHAAHCAETNQVLSLDGFGDHAVVHDLKGPAGGKEGALEFWCRSETYLDVTQIGLFQLGDRWIEGLVGYRYPNDTLVILSHQDQVSLRKESNHANDLGKWFHYCFTWDETHCSIFINGKRVEHFELEYPLVWPEEPFSLSLGALDIPKARHFSGQIDAIKLWKTSLKQDRIMASMKAVVSVADADLLWSWEEDEETKMTEWILKGDARIQQQPRTVRWQWGRWYRVSGNVTFNDGRPAEECLIYGEKKGVPVILGATNVRGEFELFMEEGSHEGVLWFYQGASQARIEMADALAGSERSLQVVFPERISLSGFARALDDKTPIPGVFIEAYAWNEDETLGPVRARDLTDRLGYYEFYDLPEGKYLLKVRASHLEDSVQTEPLGGEASLRLEHKVTIINSQFHQRIDFRCLPVETGMWEHFNTFDGIPGIPVFSVRADEKQGIWVGSSTWLRRYVGQSFLEVETEALRIVDYTSFTSIPGGGLCAAANNMSSNHPRLYMFNENGLNGSLAAPMGSSAPVKLLLGSSGQLWTLTQGRVHYLEDWRKAMHQGDSALAWKHLDLDFADSIALGPHEDLWAINQQGLIHFQEGEKKIYEAEHGLRQRQVRDFLITEDGSAWLATSNGLGVLQDGRLEWYLDGYREWSDLTSLEVAGADEVWVGTRSSGLFKFSRKGVLNYNDSQNPIERYVFEISQGPGGNLWVATQNGLSRHRPRQLKVYTEANGLPKGPSYAIGIEPSSERVWIGMSWKGPAYFDGQLIKTLPQTHPMANAYIRSAGYTPEGGLWMGGNLGVSLVSEHALDLLPKPSKLRMQDFFMVCAFGTDDDMWVGRGWAGGGLIHQDVTGSSFEILSMEDGLPNDNVWALDIGQDGILRIGTNEGMVEYVNQAIQTAVGADDLATAPVYSILSHSDESLWVGTSIGVYQLKSGEEIKRMIPGLPEDFMTWKVMEDSLGRLWIATDAFGVIAFDGKLFTYFSTHNGFPSNAVYDIKEAADGSIWFATASGVAQYQSIPYKPSLELARISANGFEYSLTNAPLEIQVDTPVVFDFDWTHTSKPVEELAVIGMVKETQTQQSSMLELHLSEGNQVTWIPDIKGDYTLEWYLNDSDFNRSEPIETFFEIKPAWNKDPLKTVPLGAAAILLFGGMSVVVLRGYLHRREGRKVQARLLEQERDLRADLQRKNTELTLVKEEALAAAREADNANQAKSLFVANMSHEIRTPLNAVLGYAQILRGNHASDEPTVQSLKAIERSGQHLLSLINDILEISKIESGRMEEKVVGFNLVNLIQGVSDIVELNCTARGLAWAIRWFEMDQSDDDTLNRHYMDNVPDDFWVKADESKLKQILLNLLSNAVKFTSKGSIQLEIGIPKGWSVIQKQSGIMSVYFEVCDTGKGIAKADQGYIMTPFSQGRDTSQMYGGAGLGLAISSKLAQIFEGVIQLESQPGKGSRFYFTAQLAASHKPDDFPSQEDQHEAGIRCISPLRALVVDDIEPNRKVLALVLKEFGVEAFLASEGKETLSKIETCRPDMIFLDIAMPEMNGFEVLSRIREVKNGPKKDIKIFAVTAAVMNDEKARCLEAGFDAFFSKPVRIEKIRKTLLEFFPNHFELLNTDSNAATHTNSIQLSKEVNHHLISLIDKYAISEIVRFTEELQNSDDPAENKSASLIKKLAQQGKLKELRKRIGK